jgi:hypothetical protein
MSLSTASLPSGTTVLYPQPEQLTQILLRPLPDEWYEERVDIIKALYPHLPRHHKSRYKSWHEVYNQYIDEMKKDSSLLADVVKERDIERAAVEDYNRKLLEKRAKK